MGLLGKVKIITRNFYDFLLIELTSALFLQSRRPYNAYSWYAIWEDYTNNPLQFD